MKTLEKILVKLSGKTKGLDFNIWDWDSAVIAEKLYKYQPFTPAELHAMKFFQKIGDYLELVDPSEKWKRPYGDELNEHRNLH